MIETAVAPHVFLRRDEKEGSRSVEEEGPKRVKEEGSRRVKEEAPRRVEKGSRRGRGGHERSRSV